MMSPHTTLIPRTKVRGTCLLVSLALLAFVAIPGIADEKAAHGPEREIDFESEIYPILQQRCHVCHGASQQLGEFRLDSKGVALAGGTSGPNIVPGEAGESPLFQRIAGIGELNAMPMTGERLSADDIGLIEAWINQGAKWPDGVGVASDSVEQHWAYQPPVRHAPPAVGRADMVRNPIDSFVLARLERDGLSFAPEASRETLVRRVSLDLTGLPPTIEDVERFLEDDGPDAYARLVERTLKSPHFGEHWAGYWLDLARYADTNGYESDEPRTMWAYRDWVVDAFNRNLPFDRFTIEQLAGDLLPEATVDQVVATGFHRNTMLNNEAGTKNDEFYDATVKDRVDTTATVWLGSTVGCAQCHDHKYDPFRQSEYYRLYAIFNNTADSAIKISEELDVFRGDEQELRRRTAELEAAKAVLDTPTPELATAQRAWEERTVPDLALWDNAWQILRPVTAASSGDAILEVLPDGSVHAREPGEGRETYEVTFEPESTSLTGLRIEALHDDSLPESGPGWGEAGAFSLTGVEVEAWTPQRANRQRELVGSEPVWSHWHTIGPFRVRNRDEAFSTAFPPESEIDFAATYEEGHLAWLERKTWADGRVHYMNYIPDDSETNCASYVFRTVEVREPTSVLVSLGTLKGVKVWLNSKLVLSTDPTRNIAPDQEEIRLELRPGTNEILLKLTNDQGPYGFYYQSFFGDQRESRLHVASATGDHGGWSTVDLAGVLDGKAETAWSPGAETFRDAGHRRATLRFAQPVDLPAGSQLKVRLIHDSPEGSKRVLGRFRVSATSLDETKLAAFQETPRKVRRVLAIGDDQRSKVTSAQLSAFFRSIAPELFDERSRYASLKSSLEAFHNEHTTKTLVMRELPEPRETHVQNRGNFLDLAERIQPGVPSVLAAGHPTEVGDRLALAKWLTDGNNPLTARVRVNQIWNRLFGQGLVTTPEDFGSQGDRPSHPELMDWLATEFVRLGWDTQNLLRTILTSAVYRQDSAASPVKVEKDPRNVLLSRGARYRVEAETVRDIALASSGQLSRKIGGPSVFPPQPAQVFGDHFIEGGFKHWPTSEGADRYRRGLYTFYKRTIVYPAFMNFDAPDRTVCTVDRSLSNTPLQALNTLNDPAFFEAAGALAEKMLSEGGSSGTDRISHGFRTVLARTPRADELDRLLAFLDRMAAKYEAERTEAADLVEKALHGLRTDLPDSSVAPWVMVANVLLNLDESFTRE